MQNSYRRGALWIGLVYVVDEYHVPIGYFILAYLSNKM